LVHILLKFAKRGPFREVPELPPNACYDSLSGLWTIDGQFMAKMPDLDRSTKKFDIETGEDRKGQ
jgi:hypothetical protein